MNTPKIKIRKSLLNKIWRALNPNFAEYRHEYRCIFYDRDTFQQWDELYYAKGLTDLFLMLKHDKKLKKTIVITERDYIEQYDFRKYYDRLTA